MSTTDETLEAADVPADEICPEHGNFAKVNYWRYRCKGCDLAGAAHRRRRQREDQCSFHMSESGLIGWTKRATFENFVVTLPAQKKALEACQALVAKDQRGDTPWLLGPPGTGKTHLGSAMVSHVIRERGYPAAIHSAREIVRMLRATWGKKEAEFSEAEVLEKFANLSLLVIDEVGVGFGTDSEIVQLFDVIDMRYRLERPTALISNLTAPDLKPVLGEAAYDRLREGAKLVPMKWPSHRGSARSAD